MKRILSTGAVVALSLTILTLLFSELGESSAAGPRIQLPAAPALPVPPPVPQFGTPPASFRLADISNTLFSGPNTFNSTTQLFSPWTLPPFGGRFQNTPFPLIVITPDGRIGPFWTLPPIPPPARGVMGAMPMMFNPGFPAVTFINGPVAIHFAAGAGKGGGAVNNQIFIKPAGVGGGVGGMNGMYGGF